MLSLMQLKLLTLIKQYGFVYVNTCLRIINKTEMSTLLRLKYISKNNDIVSLLQKGSEMTEYIEKLVVVGGNNKSKEKAAKTANIAAILMMNNIPSIDRLPIRDENAFVPSNIWRKFRTCIISTSRFLGVLQYNYKRIVLYDVGNGVFEWQGYAEYSHFFRTYGEHETKADAMLIVCNDGMGMTIAENIIRHTLWKRNTLIKDYFCCEIPKPQKYSRAEITVRTDYEISLFCEQSEVMDILTAYSNKKDGGIFFREDVVNRCRYISNSHNDLLLYIRAIIEANDMHPYWQYYISLPKRYYSLLHNFKTKLKERSR